LTTEAISKSSFETVSIIPTALKTKKELYMKNYIAVMGILLCCASCSSPLLKWIETPPSEPRTYSASDKAIIGFSFGIPGETDEIRAGPSGTDGKIPITVVLPQGSNKSNLPPPAIDFIGKSVSPQSGEYKDFSSPVDYLVFAADGSSAVYTVEVLVKNSAPGLIKWFDLQLPGTNILAEGVVTEGKEDGQPGDIVIHVPSGTNLSGLTAKIVQTGTLEPPNGPSHPETAVTITGDFSTDKTYRVTVGGSSRDYVVRVVKDKSGEKEITALSFDGPGSGGTAIIGSQSQDGIFPIIATVPAGTPIGSLKPVITHTGHSLTGPEVSSSGTGPGIVSAEQPVNFSDPVNQPVIYTVTAEDGSEQEYSITVFASGGNSAKQITGFFVPLQGNERAAGVINETAKTVTVIVPAGTNLNSLNPTIYHTGLSISPLSGEPKNFTNSKTNPVRYTVKARDNTTQDYMVTVFTAARSDKDITGFYFSGVDGTTVIGAAPGADGIPIYVTIPSGVLKTSLQPVITHTGVKIAGLGLAAGGVAAPLPYAPPTVVSGTFEDFSDPVIYTVSAEDGSERDYAVRVIQVVDNFGPNPVAQIDAFYFGNPLAIGEIAQGEAGEPGTISVTVPWDTNLSTLVPTIFYTGGKIGLKDNTDSEVPDKPARIGADFTLPVEYTVTATDEYITKTYEVTVTKTAKPKSSAREITAFSFTEVDTAGTTTIIASTPNAAGKFPIDITVPPPSSGTIEDYLKELTPKITHTGAFITSLGGTDQSDNPFIDSPRDFNTSKTYTVTAEDNQTREYLVTVRVEDNNLKKITGFYFSNPMAVGVIDQNAHTITVKVPYGTNPANLTPTVYYEGLSLDPASGGAEDFSSPRIYTVTARNKTVQPYTVKVIPERNSAKEISAISFPGLGVLETVIGSVPGSDGHIPISVRVSQNTSSLEGIVPTITHTGVSISPGPGTAQNFSGPVFYRVSAEDGSTKDYAVSVHVEGGAVITGFVFNLALNSSLTKQVVGSINQAEYTILAVLPYGTDPDVLTDLVPTITYIGANIKPQGGAESTVNPFNDDTGRNFSGSVDTPLVYTVATADSVTQDYTVTVTIAASNFTIDYSGLSDPGLLSDSYDQSTGILTLKLNLDPDGNSVPDYEAPFEWVLDGKTLAVSSSEPRLALQTSGLKPGQHEIVVVVTKIGVLPPYPSHYTNKVYFMVQE
jgi:hypothetical protein